MDFCNSFWGLDDVGVDVLFARMQSAAQTIEDLNTFWKERYISDPIYSTLSVSKHVDRASIEEDYANRFAKLAEMSLGRDEIGYVFCLSIFSILYTLSA